MSINAYEIRASMLLSLLVNIRILSCFFFFLLVIFNNFLVMPVVREKIKVKLLTGAPTILLNKQIDTPPVVALKTIKPSKHLS